MSRYKQEPFNGVLFLLREPNTSGKPVSKEDNEWISSVLNFRDAENANRYRKSFISMLNHVGLEKDELPFSAFDNIHPYSGEAKRSNEYYAISSNERAERAFLMIFNLNMCLPVMMFITQ